MAKDKEILIINRKAKFEYSFIQEIEAGIMLTGTEVKSLRNGNANMNDAYCLFVKNELYLKSLYIGEYEFGNINNHEPRRDRKLLLKRPELKKFQRRVVEKGLTLVPYKIYFSERGLAKVVLALAQGKKSYDKRQSIKERENKRDLDRIKKSQGN